MSAFNRLTKHSKSGKIRFQIDPKHKTETSPEKLLKLPPLSSFLWPYHWHNTTRHPRPPPVLMIIFITICIGITNKIPVFVGSDVKSLQVFFRDSEARDANLDYNMVESLNHWECQSNHIIEEQWKRWRWGGHKFLDPKIKCECILKIHFMASFQKLSVHSMWFLGNEI